MTDRGWYNRRLVHTCSAERDTGTAVSSSGEPQESWASVGTAIACRYVETRNRYATEAQGFVTRIDSMLLVKFDEDFEVDDRVFLIQDADGTAVAAGTFSVQQVVQRRAIDGVLHHHGLLLERVKTT